MLVAKKVPTLPLPSFDMPLFLSCENMFFSLKLQFSKSKCAEFIEISFAYSTLSTCLAISRALP